MKVLLEYCFDHHSARDLYQHVARSLRRRGVEAQVVRSADGMDLSPYDVLISHDFLDGRVGAGPTPCCYGGREMTRPEGLSLIAQVGVPVIPWAPAESHGEVLDLFDRWRAQRLLLKRSGTCKGDGVSAFDRRAAHGLRWDPRRDVFCPDVNDADGDVYKAEIFNGRLILAWVSRSPPLSRSFQGFRAGVKGAYGRRRLFRYPRPLRAVTCELSRVLTSRGVGYCSLDLMKNPAGELVAIEINTGQVATWWTGRFLRMRWRYASAVRALVEGHGGPPGAA